MLTHMNVSNYLGNITCSHVNHEICISKFNPSKNYLHLGLEGGSAFTGSPMRVLSKDL